MQGSHGSGRAPGAATLLGGLQVPDQASPALAAAEVKYLRLQARALETPLLGCTPGTVSAADLCIEHTMQFMPWLPCNGRQAEQFDSPCTAPPACMQGWAVGSKGRGKDSHSCCGSSADGRSGLQALSLLRVLGRPTLGAGHEAWAWGGLRWR